MFSPYYHLAGRKDPENHVAINVALYAPAGNRWAMTERGRRALRRDANLFQVGRSALRWRDDALVIEFDEVSVPRPPAQWLPRRIRGQLLLRPHFMTSEVFDLDEAGDHRWWPAAPACTVEATIDGAASWKGHGYIDSNWGCEPLESAFEYWDWARGSDGNGGSLVVYDSKARSGGGRRLMRSFAPDGTARDHEIPSSMPLKRGFWGMQRNGHADHGHGPKLVRTLEDSPFYTRSVVDTHLAGQAVQMIHESFSGRRISNPVVRAMLPFRMPRRSGSSL